MLWMEISYQVIVLAPLRKRKLHHHGYLLIFVPNTIFYTFELKIERLNRTLRDPSHLMLELVTVIKMAEVQMISVYIKEVFQQPTPLRGSTVHRVQEVVTSASIHHQISHILSYVNLKHMASKLRRSD